MLAEILAGQVFRKSSQHAGRRTFAGCAVSPVVRHKSPASTLPDMLARFLLL